MRTLLLVFLVFAAELVSAENVTVAADASYVPGSGQFRAIAVAQGTNGIGIKAVEFSAAASNGTVTAALNVAALTFGNPSAGTGYPGVSFYYGYLGADAVGSYNPGTGSAIGSVTGALAETAAAFSHIFVYYNNDGKPGFQANLNTSFWDCTNSPAYDCLNISLAIDLKTLNWSAVSVSKLSCPDNYPVNCSVYVFSTSGSLTGGANPVITFALKLATHPLRIDGVLVTPEFAKIDVSVWYPWASSGAQANAAVGLIFVGAGKAAVAAAWANVNIATSLFNTTRDGFDFAGSTGASAYFGWDRTVIVGGSVQSTVVTQGFTAAGVVSASAVATVGNLVPNPAYATLLASWKASATAWTTIGWEVQFVFFSWADVQPASVVWDPVVGNNYAVSPPSGPSGSTTSGSSPSSTTSGNSAVPATSGASVFSSSVVFAVVSVVALLWSQFF